MRIAIDIDSTLHHYWDVLSEAAQRRFGVELPYDGQSTWTIPRLKDHQLAAVIKETHKDEAILAAQPYPGAVEAVNRWAAAGSYIHITSHRATGCQAATEQWLRQIGLRYDDLHCSYDKIARCVELGIELLIDDSPVNLTRALEAGMRAATIEHPWNRDVIEDEDVIAAADWPGLAAKLDPLVLGREAA
jgi:uncharacterized protein